MTSGGIFVQSFVAALSVVAHPAEMDVGAAALDFLGG
jgi:hypothetical protein